MWTNPQSVGDALKFQFKNVQLYQNLFSYTKLQLESEKFKVAIYKSRIYISSYLKELLSRQKNVPINCPVLL